MKLCLIVLVVLISLEAVAASSFTRLLGSALVVQKKAKKAATKANVAHSKSKKIKVTPADQLQDAKVVQEKKAVMQTDDVDVQKDNKSIKVAQRQDAMIGRKEMFLTIAQMLLSRFILKVNYKDAKSLLYARASFVAYLILFQALIWLLKYQINQRDDNTILAVNPSSGMDSLLNTVGRLSGQSAMTSTLLSLSKLTNGAAAKTLTVKAHDLEHVQKLSSKLYFDLATTSLLHYLFGFQSLVLLTPMRGLAGLLKNQLVLLHVFRFKPVGKLARPFKTPMDEFISSLANPKTPAVSSVKVSSAESSVTSAKAEKIAAGIDSVEQPTVTTTTVKTETVVEEEDTVVESDEEQDEEIEEHSQNEPHTVAVDQEISTAGDAGDVSIDSVESEPPVEATGDSDLGGEEGMEDDGEDGEEEDGADTDDAGAAGDSAEDIEEENDYAIEEVNSAKDKEDADNDLEDEESGDEGEEENDEGVDVEDEGEGNTEERDEENENEDEEEGENEGDIEASEEEEDGEDTDIDGTDEDVSDCSREVEEEEGEEEEDDTELLEAIDQLGE